MLKQSLVTSVSTTQFAHEDNPKVAAGAMRLGDHDHHDEYLQRIKILLKESDCSIKDHIPSSLWSDWPKNLL